MGLPTDTPAAADPYASLYPSMAPKQVQPAPKASLPPSAATETMQAQPAKATQQPATGAAPVVAPQAVADEIDPGTVTAAQALARELNLPSDQAAKVLAHHKALASADTARWAAENTAWERQIREDPEIGGANLDTAISDARALLNEFASPELMRLLAHTGYGSHPELVRFMARVAKAMGPPPGQNQFRSIYTSMPNA